MKYEIKTLEEVTLIVPVGGGDSIARVYKPEHAQTLLDALNFVPAHPLECEGCRLSDGETGGQVRVLGKALPFRDFGGIPNIIEGGLHLLRDAVRNGDPAKELEFRINDLIKDVERLQIVTPK